MIFISFSLVSGLLSTVKSWKRCPSTIRPPSRSCRKHKSRVACLVMSLPLISSEFKPSKSSIISSSVRVPVPEPRLASDSSRRGVCKKSESTCHCMCNTGLILKTVNPLTPVQAVAGCDEPWPFFHFWRHPYWPKLASPILNLCRRKTSFHWCPDQSDWLHGARGMYINVQKVEWKSQSKISSHYTWLLHRKNCLSRWCFLKSFLTLSKPSRRSITAAKRKEKEKKERPPKKISKIKKPKDILRSLSQNFDFNACPNQNVIKRDASGKNSKLPCCKCIFDQIKANLAEIQPEKRQNVQKRVFCKKLWGSMG